MSRSITSLTASLRTEVTAAAKQLTKRQVNVLVKKHKLPGSVGGRGTSWTIEVKNESEKKKVEKVLGSLGGFMTGSGGWVLSQDYKSKGDWGDKSSPHHYAADGGMTAEDFAKKVEAGLPASVKKYAKARAMKSVGTMVVMIDFAYTPSKSGVDLLNARNTRILVQGWGKDGQAEKVSASSVRSNDMPKLRKKSGAPDKVAQYLVTYFKKNESAMMEGDPHKSASAKVARLTGDLRQVTAAAMPPAALSAAKKWSERLSDAQRKLAAKVAKELKRTGFSTGMFGDMKKLGLKSFNMGSFLQMSQMPDAKLNRIRDQTVEMLEMGAAAAHEKYAGWKQADTEGVNANTTMPVKVSFRGTKEPYYKDPMYSTYKGNLTVALGTSSERSPVEFVASRGGMQSVKAPKMPYSLAEAAVFALLKNRAL